MCTKEIQEQLKKAKLVRQIMKEYLLDISIFVSPKKASSCGVFSNRACSDEK